MLLPRKFVIYQNTQILSYLFFFNWNLIDPDINSRLFAYAKFDFFIFRLNLFAASQCETFLNSALIISSVLSSLLPEKNKVVSSVSSSVSSHRCVMCHLQIEKT